MSVDAPMQPRAAIWHDVECGAYAGDLGLWVELAREAGGPVLELGGGTGRVALALAETGYEVTAVERDRALLAELRRRAADADHAIEAVEGDAREFNLDRRYALALAPMQLVQLLGDEADRRRMLACVAAHLRPGGRFALALVAGELDGPGSYRPLPDVRELDGWIYSSLPLETRAVSGAIEVRRLRQLVSPAGELTDELDVTRLARLSPAQLEEEAATCGLRPAGRRQIASTPDHVGSTAVLLERG